MKADKLMDAITELDDEILNEAAGEPSAAARNRAKNGRKTILFKFAAAAAALAVTVGGIVMITRKPAQNTPTAAGTKVVEADPSSKADALVQPVYPEEWTREQELNSKVPFTEWPYRVRWTAGKEAADLYRGFFADMMLLLLSDQNEESAVMSPVNIFMATAMLAEITDGETRQEILDALGVADIELLRDQAAKIWGLCYKDDGYEKTVLGNSLWLNDTLNYRSETVQRLADSYYASAFRGEMGSDKYNSLLQKWINDMTGGLLKNQVQSLELPAGTPLALVSTIWHETKWGFEFLKENTKPGIFHSPSGDIEVDFMYDPGAEGMYLYGDNFKIMFKGTNQGRVWFFLPDEGTSLAEMMQEESFREFLSYTYSDMDYFASYTESQPKTTRGITGVFAHVNLTVPKLDITYQQDLAEALQAVGIQTAFVAGDADYSPITDLEGVFLSKAGQGTRLIMDEEGVSAASYVEMLAGGAELEDEIDFVCDRPFFMMVTGFDEVPLFAGVVNVP